MSFPKRENFNCEFSSIQTLSANRESQLMPNPRLPLLGFPPDAAAQKSRANWNELVPEITFALHLCGAHHNFVSIETVGSQLMRTYPRSFSTRLDGKTIIDLSLVYLTLRKAKPSPRELIRGDWYCGWKLTRKGSRFAKDIERRIRKLD